MIDSELSGEQYVATFGKDAAVGCFTATEPIALRRGDQVLLRTPRGIEVGSILCPATVRQARLLGAQVHGDLLRSFDADDRRRLVDLRRQASAILDVAHALADESEADLMVLDAEMPTRIFT